MARRTRWSSARQRLSTPCPCVAQIGNQECGPVLWNCLDEKWALIRPAATCANRAKGLTATIVSKLAEDQSVGPGETWVFSSRSQPTVSPDSELSNGKVDGKVSPCFTTPGGRV